MLTTLVGRKSKEGSKAVFNPEDVLPHQLVKSSSTCNPEHDDEQAATKAGEMVHGLRITCRSTEPSSSSGRKWAAGRCSLARQVAGCSSQGYQGFPYDREDGRWSFGTGPEWTLLESWLPRPRSGVWVARRRRFPARASFQLRLCWLGMEAGAARRLNDQRSHRAVGCCEAGCLACRVPTSCGAAGGGAPVTSRTCNPNHGRCLASSSRTLHPPPLRRS